MSMNNNRIKNTYYDVKHPAGFGSYTTLRRYLPSDIKNEEIKEFLREQESYTLHAPRIKKFKRDYVFVSNIDDVWGVDLCDMRKYKKDNDNFTFILCVIDVLSKFAWVRCLKDKTSRSVQIAFENILAVSGRKPVKVNCDKGKEFVGKDFKLYLNKNDIELYHNENSDIKVSVCERFIKTFKSKLWRFFTYSGNTRYLEICQDIVESYNNTIHSSIGKAPTDVTEHNFLTTWEKLYQNKLNLPGLKPKCKIGEYVRISKERSAFAKGYTGNWSQEIFKITNVLHRRPILYELQDLNKEKIVGRFYEKEIQKIKLPKYHKIHKILRTRGKAGSQEHFVSWEGYPPSFNSWVKASDFK